MNSTEAKFVVGDTHRRLTLTIRDKYGKRVDLGDATAVHLRVNVTAGVEERAMTKDTPMGQVHYQFTSADFAEILPGTWDARVRITWPDGQDTAPTKEPFKLEVAAEFPS